MENKKTFGGYICRRRKELGMTQRELADRLYVTESAVSKWERGMSYPDVTLLRDICAALEISEHELLTASEDTEKRTAERLAARYLRLTRRYRATMYLLYGGILLGCGIGCLASGAGWFPISLTAVLLAASVTLLPSLAAARPRLEPYKWPIGFGCGAVSLELLLLACWQYMGGDWLPMACAGSLFGMALVLLPVLLPSMPLPPWLNGRKTALYLAVMTVLLMALLLVGAVTSGGDWFAPAAMSTLFGLSLVFTPVFLRQLPVPELVRKCRLSAYLGMELVLLLVLLFTWSLYAGGTWFPLAAVSTVFGVGLFLLPVPLRQVPLPQELRRHKALVYLTIETLLLFALLAAAAWYEGGSWFLPAGVPHAAVGLALPWGLLGIIRYLPLSRWGRASLAFAWTGLWTWLAPWATDRIMVLNGWYNSNPYPLRIPHDLSRWDADYTGWNIVFLVLVSLAVLAVLSAAAGFWQKRKNRPETPR